MIVSYYANNSFIPQLLNISFLLPWYPSAASTVWEFFILKICITIYTNHRSTKKKKKKQNVGCLVNVLYDTRRNNLFYQIFNID